MTAGQAAVVAIDGGNSKTEVALVAADGTLLASVRGPGASQERFGVRTAARMLGQMARSAAAEAGITGPVVASHTSACLAGADLPSEEEELAAAMREEGWSLTSAVANDTFAVLRAGLLPAGPSWGVAVTCGAGINCVGLAPDGKTTRFLALGTLTGDWGGGGGLGSAVMWWSSRAEDGRGAPTALAPAVAAHFGLDSVYDVAVAFHRGEIAQDDLLTLSAVLFAVAATGDQVARSLVERQAEEVCSMAMTAMRRLSIDKVPCTPVVLGGGVLEARDPLLTAAIERRLAVAAPVATPVVVESPPVTGAALLGLDYLAAEAGLAPDKSAEFRLREATARVLAAPKLSATWPGQEAGLGPGGGQAGRREGWGHERGE